MIQMENKNKGNLFWMGFFLGGLFGAFIILLLGTREGKKFASRLLEKGELFEDDLEQKISQIEKKGEELLEHVENVKEKVVQEVEEGKQTVSDSLISRMDETLTKIENIQKKGAKLTEDVHKRFFRRNGKKLSA